MNKSKMVRSGAQKRKAKKDAEENATKLRKLDAFFSKTDNTDPAGGDQSVGESDTEQTGM